MTKPHDPYREVGMDQPHLTDEGSDAPLAPGTVREVAPGVTAETSGTALAHSSFAQPTPMPAAVCPICGEADCFWFSSPALRGFPAKHPWKVGDRVCFANRPLGQVFRITRVHGGEEPTIEIQNSAGIYGSGLFVRAPAEPVSLPAVEVEARDTICFTCEDRVATRTVKICGVCYGESTEEDFQPRPADPVSLPAIELSPIETARAKAGTDRLPKLEPMLPGSVCADHIDSEDVVLDLRSIARELHNGGAKLVSCRQWTSSLKRTCYLVVFDS